MGGIEKNGEKRRLGRYQEKGNPTFFPFSKEDKEA